VTAVSVLGVVRMSWGGQNELVMDPPVLRVPGVSWGLLTVVSALAAAGGLWVALTPTGDQTKLTDRTWEQFAADDPEFASLYSMDLVMLGTFAAGLGLLATVVSAIPYRRGERWAWYALWLVPGTLGTVTARMLVDRYPAGYPYAGLSALAAAALLLPIRSFLRPRD